VFFIVLGGVILFYLIERYLLSEKIEEADPVALHRLEEKIHGIEEKLHLTGSQMSDGDREKRIEKPARENKATAARK